MQLSSLILTETDHWIALNKPSGLLSVPDRMGKEPSLKMMLREKYGNIFVVHRLDRETSGVILFAKDESTHQELNRQFEERKTEKIYQGLVLGTPADEAGSITTPIAVHPAEDGRMMTHAKGKPSHTDYRVLEVLRPYSWMQFNIHTGRTHQIRVHMQGLGHPIVCDTLYGDGKPVLVSSLRKKFKLAKSAEEERPILGRLALHAQRLCFFDHEEKEHCIEAPLPKDLTATLSQLRKGQSKR
ncbi:MAG: RNA pseudouridine synthase [Chitinophagales bacterium]|jgi:23S rRNA pseudouridine955/2504/2580 synthase/23S rRNA pseudouridine1911/1915/1917 synthase|nr:RNA pseudouridine synthase [Chitinophagales bacterium]